VRNALLTVVIGVSLMAGLIGLFAWSPWVSKEREREQAWLETMVEWSDRYDGPLGRSCQRRLENVVGAAPTKRFEPVAGSVRRWCRGSDWSGVTASLIDAHIEGAERTHEADFSKLASSIAGLDARVYCWSEQDWTPLSEDYDLVDPREEFWLAGLAFVAEDEIQLSSDVCEPLRLFFRGKYTPYLNTQSYQLAEAIVTLAHEAEHLRTPAASEAVVECHALQRARDLVREAGRRRWYQEEIAGLAWEVGYPQQFADYRTKDCRDDGPLDLRPQSHVWP
jgi:hypothetical protein